MPRFATKTGLAHALAFGVLLFLSPLDAKSLRGSEGRRERFLTLEDKAITTAAPEEDKGMITNALVGGAAAWATGGSVMQGAAGGVIGGAMTGSPMGAAAGGYLGGSKEAIPVESNKAAITTIAPAEKNAVNNGIVGAEAALATGGDPYRGAIGGAIGGVVAKEYGDHKDKQVIPEGDKAAITTEPEEDKGMITNAIVGAGAAWATGGSMTQGAVGGVIGGAMTGSPVGAAAGGYLGGSKEETSVEDKAMAVEPQEDKGIMTGLFVGAIKGAAALPIKEAIPEVPPAGEDKGMITNALVGGAAAWATGGSVMQGAAGGVIGGAMTGSPMGAAAGGYLGGSKEAIPEGDKAAITTTAPGEKNSVTTDAIIGAGVAYATGGDPWQGAIGGVTGGAAADAIQGH
jgi:hypothetical protein